MEYIKWWILHKSVVISAECQLNIKFKFIFKSNQGLAGTNVLMLCRKFEPIPTSIFQVMAILRKCQNSEKYPVFIAHAFFQKMAPKSPKIFITFSDIYWCPYAMYKVWADSDFNFLSYDHFLKWANFWKIPCTIAHAFFQKMAPKSPKIFITFSDIYWCPYAMYKVWADSDFNFLSYDHFLRWANFWKIPCTIAHAFFQKMAPKSPKIFITFSDTYWCPYAMYKVWANSDFKFLSYDHF